MISPPALVDRTLDAPVVQGTTGEVAALALTTSHICPRGRLTLARGGTLAKLSGRIGPQPPSKGPGWYGRDGNGNPLPPPIRGTIKGHSKRSRSRQMQHLASIDRAALPCLPLFVTLTYPEHWPADPQQWKRDHRTLWKRIERKYPDAAAHWRMEFQQRGAPHFHDLIFGVPFISKKWLARQWYEVVGSGDPKHLRRGTRIEKTKTWGHVVSYMSKYLAKVAVCNSAHVSAEVGRHWGVFNAAGIPRQLEHLDVDDEGFQRVRRVLRGLAKSRGRHWTCFGRYSGGWTFVSDDTMGKLTRVVMMSDRWINGP